MELSWLQRDEAAYPEAAGRVLGASVPARIAALGNAALLGQPALAVFCSAKCPGRLILQTYDLTRALRDGRPQRRQARRKDAVVIAQQDPHAAECTLRR